MRKLLLTTLLAICTLLSAQVTITMEQDGGVYKVPCVVNGAKMKFIFDTDFNFLFCSYTYMDA